MLRRFANAAWEATRRYFVAGLVAFAPIAITVWAIAWIIRRLDNLLLPWVLSWVMPGLEEAPKLPPLVGVLFTFVVILIAGVFVRHFFGQELVRFGERLLSRVPVARGIYGGVKQLFEAIFTTSAGTTQFNRVVLVEYPRRGLWALAFVTGIARGPVARALSEQRMVNCFVPTTPNPTSGFYLVVAEEDIREVDLSVEDAFKVIMSAGLVAPETVTHRDGEPAATPVPSRGGAAEPRPLS